MVVPGGGKKTNPGKKIEHAPKLNREGLESFRLGRRQMLGGGGGAWWKTWHYHEGAKANK